MKISPALRPLSLLFVVLMPLPASAALPDDAPVDFSRDIQPLLARRCYACHGNDASEGGLRLHDQDASRKQLDSGEFAILPGKAAASELLARVSSSDESLRMPPEGEPLKPAEIEAIRKWIDQGAVYTKHWAFQPMDLPEVPSPRNSEWVRNPLDSFVLARLESNGLAPNSAADRRTLCRRIYYDLIGLPPTQQQLEEFVNDDSPDAYERLVDRLLASPKYGEKWARFWLDIVRYAESNSFERDNPKPNVWKYRDWVIRSLNEDKPYDRFVKEQLAGDELDNVTPDTMTATGYYRLGVWDDEPADPKQAVADELDDLISTTGQAFLGLTVGCARCHDHKIDPMPQVEYYQLKAYFADVTSYGTKRDQSGANQHMIGDPAIEEERQQLLRREREINGERRRMEQAAITRMPGVMQRQTEGRERGKVLENHLQEFMQGDEHSLYTDLGKQLDEVRKQLRALPQPEKVLALARRQMPPRTTHIHERGNPHSPGDVVEPNVPELFGLAAPDLPPLAQGAKSAGRRRVLAEWMVDPNNPLTARVITNRIWQHHFGRGIVRSSNNFGKLGTPPTHPELLDWLSHYLIENNWQLKPLHRLMVTSSTYRMSSESQAAGLAADPLNNLYWRFDARRLTAEELRDSVLAVSGSLTDQVYGPSMYPRLSREVLATQSRPGQNWGNSNDRDRFRRSVYIHIKRSLLVPMMSAFDAPDPDVTCEARFNTTQPAQAFALLHSQFMHEQAGLLAKRATAAAGDDQEKQIATAIELVLGRTAAPTDMEDATDLIDKLKTKHNKSPEEAFRLYCLALLNFSEFVYLD